MKAFNRAVREGRIEVAPELRPNVSHANEIEAARALFGIDLTAGINSHPAADPKRDALESRFGLLVNWTLQRRGIEIDGDTRAALLEHVERATTKAAEQLKRNAVGDYTPDVAAASFPAFETDLTLMALFDRWKAETGPSGSTIMSWRTVVRSLATFLKHDRASRITTESLIAWKDHLLASGLSPRTVRDGHLTAIKAVMSYAVSNRLIPANPVTGVKVAVRQRAGTRMLPYSDEEVGRLLAIARHERNPARRWLPWLAALTGARIAELAQLWGSRVTVIDGVHVLQLRPAEDGGSLKNEGSERTIPIHPALIERGFLEFARAKGAGPLFYRRSSGEADRRHASKGVSNHFAVWIRKQEGFNDERKAPAHALRHWFKSTADRVGMSERMADFIQGHAPRSEADGYRHYALSSLAEPIACVPVPDPSS